MCEREAYENDEPMYTTKDKYTTKMQPRHVPVGQKFRAAYPYNIHDRRTHTWHSCAHPLRAPGRPPLLTATCFRSFVGQQRASTWLWPDDAAPLSASHVSAQDHVVCKFVKPEDMHLLHRAAVGLASGGIASFMCCPIEVNAAAHFVLCLLSARTSESCG